MSLTIGITMLASAVFGMPAYAATDAPLPTAQVFIPQTETVKQYVENYFADIPVLVDIAGCESKFRQFGKDGSVLHGDVYQDLGVMQINEHYHGSEAAGIRLDLTTIEGNVEFARSLYEKEGTTPWLSSSKCWEGVGVQSDKTLAINTSSTS